MIPMSVMADSASTNDKSIKAVAEREAAVAPAKRRYSKGPAKSAAVIDQSHKKWHPIMKLLVQANGVDPLCVEMLSETEFVIHNEHGPW